MKLLKFATIDIGSNAVRLLVSNVYEDKDQVYYKKSSLIRIPLRLGLESFAQKKISAQTRRKLVDTMIAFSYLIKVQDVLAYKGAATSAMREATNGDAVVKEIKKKSGVIIDIIDGAEEARVLYETQMTQELDNSKVYLYVDVGGGSTELTLISNNKQKRSASFNIGTLRILSNSVKKKDWNVLKNWIEETIGKKKPYALIGSGGNINRASKMIQQKSNTMLSKQKVKALKEEIESFSLKERIIHLDMRPDRADVIIPALTIFLNIMEWSKCPRIFVPKKGLSDGLTRLLYLDYKEQLKIKN